MAGHEHAKDKVHVKAELDQEVQAMLPMTHSEYQAGAPSMQICSKQIAYDQPDHQRVIRARTPPIHGLAPAVAGAGPPAENTYRNGRGERPGVRSGCPSDGIATRSDVRKSFGSPQS
jgi:hypothetical protein